MPLSPLGRRSWTGDDWEEYVLRLLRTHYAPGDFQELPARHGGDYGLEGFSVDGCAYQCYAAEQPYSTNELYERQRNKITADVGKFILRREQLAGVLGAVRITRWLLVVPEFESARLVEHCQRKSEEVLAAALPYVAMGFRVLVITDDYFEVARRQVFSPALTPLPIAVVDPAVEAVEAWRTTNSNLVDTMLGKLRVLPALGDEARLAETAHGLLTAYVGGEDLLGQLLRDFPEVYQAILERRKAREEALSLTCAVTSATGSSVLQSALTEVVADMNAVLGDGSRHLASRLAKHAVGDWLMRCPLSFAA